MAEIDVLTAFAERAETLQLTMPAFSSATGIDITDGWHPVVKNSSTAPFIANDLKLDDQQRMLILTGPNMGGKSTYMRQVAIICLLAYSGSFVPATRAEIGPIDRIFTRIGASDDLAAGRSTFMVEMVETAHILKNATASSLVLLDEIGRGTSTFDGLSLAWACAQYLAQTTRAMTLFATHYFELTNLPDLYPGVSNVHMSAREHGGDIVFLYQVRRGPANQSYGIQVAKLAGVPDAVLAIARERLQAFEQSGFNPLQTDLFASGSTVVPAPTGNSGSSASNGIAALRDTLATMSLDELTPRDALSLLYELQEKIVAEEPVQGAE